MRMSSELKVGSVLLDGLTRGIEEGERNGCPEWSDGTSKSVNVTQEGIRERITVIRKRLHQIERDMIGKVRS